jgi:CRISPR-associated protein Csx17
MPEHRLAGCRPTPLANYLKALAILRLVADQADPRARGCFRDDCFVLETTLDVQELETFFLESYHPTPIVAPYNGGSGFYPKDNKTAIDAIRSSESPRYQEYQRAIVACDGALEVLGITEKVDADTKPKLLEACRARLPDGAVAWLDAAVVLLDEGPKYPPLLGTGGNDGRLDFTNNFMQRVLDVVPASADADTSANLSWLREALWDAPCDGLRDVAVGQFQPAGAGGLNAGPGFDGRSLVNPWEFVFMLEGALLFAGAAVRRLQRSVRGALSYPFSVRQTGAGYASASEADESARAETWMPLWGSPASLPEVSALFSEGRAEIDGCAARTGVDFARAVAALGVDRGIDAFERFGFQVRNGLAYFATPLGRFDVQHRPPADLLAPLARWLDDLRRASGDRAPGAVNRAYRQLESAIFDLCRGGTHGDTLRVLTALGACERALAKSVGWSSDPKRRTKPIPPLEPAWLGATDDGTVEQRLARALASVHGDYGGRRRWLREQIEPVRITHHDTGLRIDWDPNADREVAWRSGPVVGSLCATLRRRSILAVQHGAKHFPDVGRCSAQLEDVIAFIDGRTDDERLERLFWAYSLIDWPRVNRPPLLVPASGYVPPFYGLLKLCFPGVRFGDVSVPCEPQILRLASAGDGRRAAERAWRRLHASGLTPAAHPFELSRTVTERSAAAVMFPIDAAAMTALKKYLLQTASS